MPKRFISTGEVDTHVIVPITKQIVHRLISEMGYQKIFQDRLYFMNDFMTDSIHGTDDGNPYLTDNHVQIQINPVMNPTAVKWAPQSSNYRMGAGYAPYDFSTNPLFVCNEINTTVKEALIPCTIQLDMKFVLLSRSNAYDLLNRLYSRYAPGEMIVTNDFVFEYKVPDDVVSLLFYLYKLVMPDDADKEEYVKNYMLWMKHFSADKFMLVYNRHIKDRKEIAVRKNAFGVIGQIDLSADKPESNKTNQSTLTYEITAQYTVQFNRPAAMLVDFPVVCNNQLVDGIYLSLGNKEAKHVTATNINNTLERYNQTVKPRPDDYKDTVMIPWYDDWVVPSRAGLFAFGYYPFLSQVFTLDDTDNPEGVTEIDLADGFDEYGLKPEVLETIRDQETDSLIPWGEYMIQVFANDDLVDPSMLEFEGTKLTIKNRDKKKLYHLVLSKREGKYGINQIKRVWIADIITRREHWDTACSIPQGKIRRELPPR